MSKNGLSTEYYGGVFKFWYNPFITIGYTKVSRAIILIVYEAQAIGSHTINIMALDNCVQWTNLYNLQMWWTRISWCTKPCLGVPCCWWCSRSDDIQKNHWNIDTRRILLERICTSTCCYDGTASCLHRQPDYQHRCECMTYRGSTNSVPGLF